MSLRPHTRNGLSNSFPCVLPCKVWEVKTLFLSHSWNSGYHAYLANPDALAQELASKPKWARGHTSAAGEILAVLYPEIPDFSVAVLAEEQHKVTGFVTKR